MRVPGLLEKRVNGRASLGDKYDELCDSFRYALCKRGRPLSSIIHKIEESMYKPLKQF